MTKSELLEIMKDVPDDTEIQLCTIWNDDSADFSGSGVCECHYDSNRDKVFLTPSNISI